jgi:hypothetical protein
MCYSASTDAESSIDIPMVVDDTDQVVLAALEETPFASIRYLSRLTGLSFATVYPRLTQLLGYTARHLRRIPYILSDCQKAQRVRQNRLLLRLLEVQ